MHAQIALSVVACLLLSTCKTPQNSDETKQDVARQLTAETLAKYVEYERAMVPAYWKRLAYTFEVDLRRKGKAPAGDFAAREEALELAHHAASEKAKIDPELAGSIYALAIEYYPHRKAIESTRRLASRVHQLADAGLPHTALKKMVADSQTADLVATAKLAAFENTFGKPVMDLLETQRTALEEIWDFKSVGTGDPEVDSIIWKGMGQLNQGPSP